MAKTTPAAATPSLIKIVCTDGNPDNAKVTDQGGNSLGAVKAFRYHTKASGEIEDLEIVIAPGEVKPEPVETIVTESTAAPEG